MPDPLDHIFRAMHAILASAGCRALFDGIGGDETINPRRARILARLMSEGRLLRLVRELTATVQHQNKTFKQVIMRMLRDAVPRGVRHGWRRLRRSAAQRSPYFLARPAFTERMIAAGALAPPHLLRSSERRSERENDRFILTIIQKRARPNGALEAAAAGLSLTRPMLDKRVVEFGLAIPEDLHFSNGRMRVLARKALQDILPLEFQTRRHGQENLDPEFTSEIVDAAPKIAAQVANFADDPALSGYIDLTRLTRAPDHFNGDHLPAKTLWFANTVLLARYIRWFSTKNG